MFIDYTKSKNLRPTKFIYIKPKNRYAAKCKVLVSSSKEAYLYWMIQFTYVLVFERLGSLVFLLSRIGLCKIKRKIILTVSKACTVWWN